ncbi:serine hydrolase domain-containing protein [Mycobacterium sp. ITM-2016-00317]|uniref:serine hydrolase domain-containing protein n=1 Tax=Mycobacterium sp. ITM-2016-00317 TaxID=2099694 RepID=UPI00287FB268|nr:serine hydrolase domain-containing protein [Mycobacterium sp. ITM-2016-00317]WNG87089.1 serine hydrolase domain-containing protein [Mycobacterium sp. ITM-2016-00317]
MTDVAGHWEPRFDALAGALADEVAAGAELGASIAVDVDGELVADIWAGHADRAKTVAWQQDTIVNFWSCTKTLTALAALMLVDRAELDPFAPVARYWPEFGANGKAGIEVRHLLSHTSGVSGWQTPFGVQDIYDWPTATAHLAAQAPWWPPGSASGYHAMNYGHLIGELVRRITGTSLKQFVAEQIATPLQADVQIGARPDDHPRIAELVAPPPRESGLERLPPDHPAVLTFAAFPPGAYGVAHAETDAWRSADIGGANGHGNARGLVRALSPISLGGSAGGVRLLGPRTIELIFTEQSRGTDKVLFVPLRFGIGFGLPSPDSVPAVPAGRAGKVCWWGGWGGSLVVMDLERRATFAYVMNKMGGGTTGNARTLRYARLIDAALQDARG